MNPQQTRGPDWKVLLIGGSSGVGKTFVARELAKHLTLSLLLLDDIRLALQQTTSDQTHPELHVFLNYHPDQWRNAASIHADWISVGKAMLKPLHAIIKHHCIVPDVGAIIIEGDGILPIAGSPLPDPKDVRTVFIVEQNETQLLHNLRSRGRGFSEWDTLRQEVFAHASWVYGQWLAREADKLRLPVIEAQPQRTLLERLLSAAGVK